MQPPTGVTLVKTGKSTARVTWNSVNKVLLYQVAVWDNDTSNPLVIKNTSSASMDINNLEPCSTYIVGVSSVNVFLVPGEASNVSHTTSSEYSCKIIHLFIYYVELCTFIIPNVCNNGQTWRNVSFIPG